MPLLGLYSWSQYTVPGGFGGDLTGDTTPADWIGETFTFNGGAPTTIDINDDDAYFEDGYVETGSSQTLATAITIDGTLYPAGSVVENEFSLIDAGGQEIYVVRINGVNVGFSYATGEEPSATDTFTATQGLDGSPADNPDGTSSSTEPYDDVICFAAGTRIATPGGNRRVETLVRGDLVKTADAGFQPVQWIGQTALDLTNRPDRLKPVLFPAGSLGGGLPERDLIVSQQHRMLLHDADHALGVEPSEVFAPAKGLLPLRGVRLMRGRKSVIYVHMLLPMHAVVFSEGAPSESFFPGQTALAMMTPAQRREVWACCPALLRDPVGGYGPMARPSLTVKQARAWARAARDHPAPSARGDRPELSLAV